MEYSIKEVKFAEHIQKIEVVVIFQQKSEFCSQSAQIRVYLDWQDYTISELQAEAIKAAKAFLTEAAG